MLENNKTKLEGVHYSRYIISWVNACKSQGKIAYFGDLFEKWLEKEGCTADEIHLISEIAKMGRMELEKSAADFLAGRL